MPTSFTDPDGLTDDLDSPDHAGQHVLLNHAVNALEVAVAALGSTYDPLGAAAAVVSDVAYDATSWNGVTGIAPSKNAVRDYLATLGTAAFTAATAYDAAGAAAAAQAASQPLDSNLATIAGLTAITDSFLQAKGSVWASRTIAQVKTDLGLSGTNTGDQTSVVGITGTLAQFNTACTDADFARTDAANTFTGHQTIEGVTTTGATGTGNLVFSAGPALTGTPTAPTAAALTSTTQLATTAFVTGAVATAVTGTLKFQGATDCSSNPNYPAASKGDVYVVSVAGKIGGASGTAVDVGDEYFATADNAGGTQASVGTSWAILEHNLQGALLSANNLSDVANGTTALTNLGGIAPTGTGAVVRKSDATLINPALGTPASGNLTNCTGYPAGNLTGDVTSVGLATTIATVNSNVGAFTNASVTVNAKGQVTAASSGTAAPSAANPTASVGLTAVNGSASTFMRSDGAPALDQTAVYTLSALGVTTVNVSSANALAVGPSGNTNPTLRVVTNVASAATGLSVTGNAAGSGVTLTALSSGTDESIIIVPKAAGIIEQRNSTTAQALKVYNTYTDASNYERGVIDWKTTSNVLVIGLQIAGTGTSRSVAITTTQCTLWLSKPFGGDMLWGGGNSSSAANPLAVFDSSGGHIELRSGGMFGWSSSATDASVSKDTAVKRNAAGVVEVNTGTAGVYAWLVDAGRGRAAADVTNATATLSTAITLAGNIISGRKYVGRVVIKCNNSVAAEGIQIAFAGTSTFSSFWAAASVVASSGTDTIGTPISTSQGGTMTFTTITGETVIAVDFEGVCNGAGTLILQTAENSHTIGTLTTELGSFMWAKDTIS